MILSSKNQLNKTFISKNFLFNNIIHNYFFLFSSPAEKQKYMIIHIIIF